MSLITSINNYYKLEGNVTDTLGSLNGTPNVITFSTGNGKIGQGAGLNGSTSNLSFTSAFGLTNTSDFTVLMWCKLGAEISSGTYQLFEMNFPTSRYSVGEYQYNSGTRRLSFDWGAGTPATYNVALGTSNWNFITFVKSGSNITIYFNASSVGSGTIGSLGGSGANTAKVGNNGGGTSPYNGAIDEVGVWSRALSGSEISQLYNGGAGLQYPFTVTGGAFLMNFI